MAQAFRDVGFNISCVTEQFPGRSTVPDEEIIQWLSSRTGKDGVWITADEDAQKTHAKLILQEGISSLWIFRSRKGLSALQELQLVAFVIKKVEELVIASEHPVHFRASFNGERPRLMRLNNTIMDEKPDWRNVPLRMPSP